MQVIGLTGGIGAGKSTVAAFFADYGIPIIDADRIAHELVEPGRPALDRIVQAFGKKILTGEGRLDRKRLRERIFADNRERQRLESILHPLIRDEMLERLDALEAPYAVLVIPLLVDTGNWDMIDRILVVDCEEDQQIERVTHRDDISRQNARVIIDNQISREERLAAADDVIENTGELSVLKQQVERLHHFYLNLDQQDPLKTPSYQTANDTADSDGHLCYEHPMNERIRTFLRLDHLFKRAEYHLSSGTEHDAHAFIQTLIEINNLISRGDLKSEVLKELERQNLNLKRHSQTPSVDHGKLNALLDAQEQRMAELHRNTDQLGQHLKSDVLFNNVRQRLNLPGGTCEFDLPIYTYWLNLPVTQRTSVMQAWLTPLQPVAKAIALILETIRGASEAETKLAIKGYYEQSMNGGNKAQLIRVTTEQGQPFYPMISAGKHRVSIRFMEYVPGEPRSPQIQQDVTFDLTVCML